MGFLSKENVELIRGEEHERKMEIWRYNYPLTSAIMSDTKLTEEQIMSLVELGEERRSNE